MTKAYEHNGKVYRFVDVRFDERSGIHFGRWEHPTFKGARAKWAWLDPCGFQFEGECRVGAIPVSATRTFIGEFSIFERFGIWKPCYLYGIDLEDALQRFREEALAVGVCGGVYFRNVQEVTA